MEHEHITRGFFVPAGRHWIPQQKDVLCPVVLFTLVYGMAEWRASRSRTPRCNKEAAAAGSAYHWRGEAYSCGTSSHTSSTHTSTHTTSTHHQHTPPAHTTSTHQRRAGSAQPHLAGETQQQQQRDHAAAPDVPLTHPAARRLICGPTQLDPPAGPPRCRGTIWTYIYIFDRVSLHFHFSKLKQNPRRQTKFYLRKFHTFFK